MYLWVIVPLKRDLYVMMQVLTICTFLETLFSLSINTIFNNRFSFSSTRVLLPCFDDDSPPIEYFTPSIIYQWWMAPSIQVHHEHDQVSIDHDATAPLVLQRSSRITKPPTRYGFFGNLRYDCTNFLLSSIYTSMLSKSNIRTSSPSEEPYLGN